MPIRLYAELEMGHKKEAKFLNEIDIAIIINKLQTTVK